jgi:hypothetical protein
MNRKMNLTVALVIGSVSALATSALAADNEAALTISGTVSAVATVAIYDAANSDPLSSVTNLNLATGMSDVKIATIRELCNDFTGYTMTLALGNSESGASYLKGAIDGNTAKVAFSVKYGGDAVTFSGGLATVTSTSAISVGYPSVATKDLLITIATGSEETTPNNGASGKNVLSILPADTYSQTLTFTIAGKG